jgi:hypothetical protein
VFRRRTQLHETFNGGHTTQLCGCVPQKVGQDAGVGKSSSIHENSKILIENPLPGKSGWKNDLSLAPILLVFIFLETFFVAESTKKICQLPYIKAKSTGRGVVDHQDQVSEPFCQWNHILTFLE